MNVVDTVKNAAFASAIQAALNYMDKDPETNIPKVMSIVDKAAPEGWYESQRNAIRQGIAEKGNWYQLAQKVWELDPGVRKTFFTNFIVNASLKGSAPIIWKYCSLTRVTFSLPLCTSKKTTGPSTLLSILSLTKFESMNSRICIGSTCL